MRFAIYLRRQIVSCLFMYLALVFTGRAGFVSFFRVINSLSTKGDELDIAFKN